jgi:hypothetical protein
VQAGSGKYEAIEGKITAKIGSPSPPQTTLPFMEIVWASMTTTIII